MSPVPCKLSNMKSTNSKLSREKLVYFSGHETFPLRQMWLKKAIDQANLDGLIPKTIFSDASAIAIFGVGKNMVASIRHWALACGIMTDEGDAYRVTDFAINTLSSAGCDPYAENPSTAWFVHWQLAGKGFRSTTWYWLFNHVTAPTFKRQDLEGPLTDYALSLAPKNRLSTTTISRDLETCIRSYAPRTTNGSPEDFAEPLLGELGLLQEIHKGEYAFRRGPKAALHDGIFTYALIDFWEQTAANQSSLSFEAIAYAEGSPGRVFKLDEESIAQRLIRLADFTDGKLAWTDSAGLRQVYKKELTDNDRNEMVRKAYG